MTPAEIATLLAQVRELAELQRTAPCKFALLSPRPRGPKADLQEQFHLAYRVVFLMDRSGLTELKAVAQVADKTGKRERSVRAALDVYRHVARSAVQRRHPKVIS
jgi:hypothetical protein